MTSRPLPLALVLLGALAMGCEPTHGEGDLDAGQRAPDCIIGDAEGEAEITLVFRTVDGQIADLIDGGEVPLVLPPQGGKVTLIGVRAKNVTCRVLLFAALDDELCGGNIIGFEGRPVDLEEGADGVGTPIAPATLQNFANVPVCPTFSSTRDGNGQPYTLLVRVTELRRADEEDERVHSLSATVTPVCAEPELAADCGCECDADLVLDVDRAEQCPTINANDLPPGECPGGAG